VGRRSRGCPAARDEDEETKPTGGKKRKHFTGGKGEMTSNCPWVGEMKLPADRDEEGEGGGVEQAGNSRAEAVPVDPGKPNRMKTSCGHKRITSNFPKKHVVSVDGGERQGKGSVELPEGVNLGQGVGLARRLHAGSARQPACLPARGPREQAARPPRIPGSPLAGAAQSRVGAVHRIDEPAARAGSQKQLLCLSLPALKVS
jgi:hypothetical protein